jgi:tetratricopeptide (TPR) repeat protein
MLKKLIYIVFVAACACINASAQTIYPPMEFAKIPPQMSKEEEEMAKTPYFVLIDDAEKAIEATQYDVAINKLITAMATEPSNPLNIALLSNLGMVYYYNEQDSLAMVTLNEVVKRSPRLVSGHENRARVLTGLGRDKEAYDEYAKIIEIDSVNTDARYYHGMMALYSGNREIAERDFAVLEKIVPYSRRTYLAKGTLLALTGQDREAIPYLRKLLDYDAYAEYYAQLAGCLIAVEDFNEATDVIAKGMERYPNDPELYYYRALLNRKRYLNADARRDADKAIKLGADKHRVESIFK